MNSDALLVTRSCTTGWLDWVHGDLWITPDALVRYSLGWWMTIQHGSSVTLLKAWHADPHDPMFTPQRVLSRSLTNKYVLIRDIASASLREGHTTSRLSIKTHTGRSYKFLWLDVDPAFGYLKARLEAEIGSRLQLR